jgi:hypothetical protein
VGFLVSADNAAAIGLLSTRYGASLFVLAGEVGAHIVVVAVGWFVGYKMLGYSRLFSLIAAIALWALGVWALMGA